MDPMLLKMSLKIEDIDFLVLGVSPEDKDRVEKLSRFLTDELTKAGGLADIEVTQDRAVVEWSVPTVLEDGVQVAYVAHLLQSGLMKDPIIQLAGVAYAGGLQIVTMNLLSIGTTGKNPYLAERDARLLVVVAPFSVYALSTLGLILMDKGLTSEAAEYLSAACTLYPNDFFSNKYAGIAYTSSDKPDAAVQLLERCIQILAEVGEAPDNHLRVAYGMALLAAGMQAEASIQFMLVCGKKVPNMTLSQWVSGGYQMKADVLIELLKSEPPPATPDINPPVSQPDSVPPSKPKKPRKKKA